MGQKFCNILETLRHNSASTDTFPKVKKVTNQNGPRDAEFTWYSQSASHWICQYSMKHSLGTYDFRSTSTSLIVEVFAPQAKFLVIIMWSIAPSPFTQQIFLVTSAVYWLRSNSLKTFPNKTKLHADLFNFQMTHEEKQHTLSHFTTTLLQTQQLPAAAWIASVTWYTHCKIAHIKILQNLPRS